MKRDFETKIIGWAFIVSAILLWGGWFFSPHHLGEYIVASDFDAVNENLWTWIWMYRIHIFGWVIMGIAMFALTSIATKKPYRVLIYPGTGMIIVGTFTLAIAAAFYYTFGAWGVGKTVGKSSEEVQQIMDGLQFTNHYVTCFVRFGRVFSGVGLVILGAAFVKWNLVPKALGWLTIIMGFAAGAIIMSIPDNFDIYKPLFHVKAIWLVLMGLTFLKNGINLPEADKN
ncbi:hypothetical protein [Maribacter sp. HTCC2170]|uniref:hypothetical protein n=1 Tax=Maribacter sp. (strain HTCC2170 / KCCM 42371) TaxID=313603 RepID=UPI00006B486D|nr:hypothetical protein [Maribacter sp. HTCC2170]EAR01851.1 hypothetical protein FB2170_15023 [Maribacter sp. HTCC2170]